ncbi:unnamed protein product, partial [Meganyctiphanes norvegica]
GTMATAAYLCLIALTVTLLVVPGRGAISSGHCSYDVGCDWLGGTCKANVSPCLGEHAHDLGCSVGCYCCLPPPARETHPDQFTGGFISKRAVNTKLQMICLPWPACLVITQPFGCPCVKS